MSGMRPSARPAQIRFCARELRLIINRDKSPTVHTGGLAEELASLNGPCVGCKDCKGLCPALIVALVLPDLILSRGAGS